MQDQVATCRAYADSEGLTITDVLGDVGFGMTMDHAPLLRLLREARAGREAFVRPGPGASPFGLVCGAMFPG
jgi:hypothetical protein